MFGVVKGADEEQGFVWMLGTDGMEINKAWVMKQSVLMVKEFLKKYKYLINFIDARNKRSISWIKRCGAEVFDAQPFGAEGLPFHYFIISREE